MIKWVEEVHDEVAVMIVDGSLIVRSSVCPHFGGEFELHASEATTLQCKWHGWTFDFRTGECRNHSIAAKLRAYQSEVIDGIVHLSCETGPSR